MFGRSALALLVAFVFSPFASHAGPLQKAIPVCQVATLSSGCLDHPILSVGDRAYVVDANTSTTCVDPAAADAVATARYFHLCVYNGSGWVPDTLGVTLDKLNMKVNSYDALLGSQVVRTDVPTSYAGTMFRLIWQGITQIESGLSPVGTNCSATNVTATSTTGPGVLKLTTTSGTTDTCSLQPTTLGSAAIFPATGPLLFSARVRMTNLPDSTYKFACGLNAATPPGVTSGDTLMFEGHNNLWSTGTTTTPATVTTRGTALAAGTWYRLDMEINAAWNYISFKVDGVPVTGSPITVTAATTPMTPFCGVFKSSGATVQAVDVDFMQVEFVLTTPH